jgi:hypothetical protein
MLRGIELRYVLSLHLSVHGPATVTELLDALVFHGFSVASPAPKSVSDALRWERRRGWVAASRAAYTVPVKCHEEPSTGFIDECWRCGPQQIAQRRAKRMPTPTATEVADVVGAVWPFWLIAAGHAIVDGDPPKTVGHRAIG